MDAEKKLDPKELFKTSLSRPWKLLFLEPIVLLLSLYMAIVYGTLYMLFAGEFSVEESQLISTYANCLAQLSLLLYVPNKFTTLH